MLKLEGVMYMRKIIFISFLATVILAGCGANPAKSATNIDNSVITEDTTMTTTQSTDVIDVKVSETLGKIEEAKNTAISEIKAAIPTTQSTTKTNTQGKSDPTATVVQEPITVSLDVDSYFGDKEFIMHLTSVTRRYDYNVLVFSFSIDIKKEQLVPDRTKSYLIDNTGTKYELDGFWHGSGKGEIGFKDIYDNSDLSTVTLTYAFEGYDPVTVTFDIPGI